MNVGNKKCPACKRAWCDIRLVGQIDWFGWKADLIAKEYTKEIVIGELRKTTCGITSIQGACDLLTEIRKPGHNGFTYPQLGKRLQRDTEDGKDIVVLPADLTAQLETACEALIPFLDQGYTLRGHMDIYKPSDGWVFEYEEYGLNTVYLQYYKDDQLKIVDPSSDFAKAFQDRKKLAQNLCK